MTVRRRVVGYLVKPLIVDDDGENLTPFDVEPLEVRKTDWPNVVELTGRAEAAMLEAFAAEQAPAEPAPNRAARRANRKAKTSA